MSEAESLRIDPLLTQPLRDHVHRKLRMAILTGRYPTDARLNERQLASELGVSTTPLKEALRQLESEGLVLTLPRRGIVVKYSRQLAEEMILARAALESVVARLAADRAGDDDRAAIDATLVRMAVATQRADADQLIALNEIFHDTIHVASRCEYLVRLLERQRLYDDGTRRVIHSDPGERQRAYDEHAAIGHAIVRRDGAAAERNMREHVERSGQHYLAMVFVK